MLAKVSDDLAYQKLPEIVACREKHAMNQVRLFRAVDLNGCMFGQELIQQLLASEAGTVPHGNWFDKEISVREAQRRSRRRAATPCISTRSRTSGTSHPLRIEGLQSR